MAIDEIHLGKGLQRNTSFGSFAVIFVDAREGHPLTVRLGVATAEECRYTLHPGDTFPVGDQTWKLDRVEDAATDDWTVVLTRAG
jgi:hypothetical protein